MTTITMPCPDCGGDKGWAVPYGIDHRDGSLREYWVACGCETGEIEIETHPLDFDDVAPLMPAGPDWWFFHAEQVNAAPGASPHSGGAITP